MATGVNNIKQLNDESISSSEFESLEPDYPGENDLVALSYPNKASEKDILSPLPCDLFSNLKDDSSDNSLFWGDNFLALKHLLNSYAGKVELIYLDPPFQTGLDFHSRKLSHAYHDRLSPAVYVEFMRRRFILMRDLLSKTGSIYVHIGHQMVGQLKVLLDEVFGKGSFRNLIVRKKCSSKNYTRKQYPNLNDYILYYSKSSEYTWNPPGTSPDQEWILKEYPKIESDGRRYKLVPIHAPGIRNGETGNEWRGMMPPPGKHWQLKPSTLDELDKRGEIHWSRNGNPRRKVYLADDKMIPRTDYWDEFRDAHHQSILITGYPTEKNLEMLKVIVKAGSNEGDLVLDPFMGSGTTLHAASCLNRKWIGIDDSSEAVKTVINRLKLGLSPMGDYVNGQKAKQASLLDHGVCKDFNFFYDNRYSLEFSDVFEDIRKSLTR